MSGPNRFEVNGADAALAFIKGEGLSDRRVQLIWDLVALNSTPSLALEYSNCASTRLCLSCRLCGTRNPEHWLLFVQTPSWRWRARVRPKRLIRGALWMTGNDPRTPQSVEETAAFRG